MVWDRLAILETNTYLTTQTWFCFHNLRWPGRILPIICISCYPNFWGYIIIQPAKRAEHRHRSYVYYLVNLIHLHYAFDSFEEQIYRILNANICVSCNHDQSCRDIASRGGHFWTDTSFQNSKSICSSPVARWYGTKQRYRQRQHFSSQDHSLAGLSCFRA